ncbi:MAG TPA: sigma factor-like helix-turn-helix DNA-binding protein, partial [Burkholderiaceae bacterium]
EPAVADNTYARVEMAQLRTQLLRLVEALPAQERAVIRYHYLQQLQFEAAAALLGLSKSRVSQLHRHGLELLRAKADAVRHCDLTW